MQVNYHTIALALHLYFEAKLGSEIETEATRIYLTFSFSILAFCFCKRYFIDIIRYISPSMGGTEYLSLYVKA